jgi:hypothetical protein
MCLHRKLNSAFLHLNAYNNYWWCTECVMSRGSSISIVSGYKVDNLGSIPAEAKRIFLYPLCPDSLWGPLRLLPNGYRCPFPGVKVLPGRDAVHSPHLVLKSWISRSYTSYFICGCMVRCGTDFYTKYVKLHIVVRQLKSLWTPVLCEILSSHGGEYED